MTDKRINILLIEDNPSDAFFLQRVLDKASIRYNIVTVDKQSEYEKELAVFNPDIILSDHSLPSFNSLDALRIARKKDVNIPFILVTGTVSEEFAVECMKAGVDDYILKNSMFRLPEAMKMAFSRRSGKKEKTAAVTSEDTVKRALDEIKKRSAGERFNLNYAEALSVLILQGKKQFSDYFKEVFVFSESIDEPSGNFYWVIKEKHKLICVCGESQLNNISGVLFSSFLYHCFKDIVHASGVSSPTQILQEMDMHARAFFKQMPEENWHEKTICISVCSFDLTKKKAEYAGSNSCLVHIQNGIPALLHGNKLKFGSKGSVAKQYEQSSMTLSKDDVFYFFSENFTKLFDGNNDTKKTQRLLMNVFDTLQEVSMKEQEKLVSTSFAEWKTLAGKTENVLLLGLKL